MIVTVRAGAAALRSAATVACGIAEDERRLAPELAALDRAGGGAIAALLASRDFTGRALELEVLHPTRGKARRLVLVGLGPRAEITSHRVRQSVALVTRRTRDLRAGSLAVVLPWPDTSAERAEWAQAAAEGAWLGHWSHTPYLADPGPAPLPRVVLAVRNAATAAAMQSAVTLGDRLGESVLLARDLAATPGQDLTPELLAERAREVAKGAGARIEVMDVPQMERLGMNALLAVGRGSVNPPRFIVLDRPPSVVRANQRAGRRGAGKAAPTIVVIGKGVTFDTGGISLKPRENMNKMKYDMSGAAAVLGLFHALPALQPAARVVGLIPSAENMPGGRAIKPGDVVRALDGTTIEITNTDAEGRLILADALGYARRLEPHTVVDLATLTGAISIALGHQAAGLFTDDDTLAAELTAAGEASAERLWRMPLWDSYAGELRSDTADVLNSAGREGGAILAAVFLKRFARGFRWAHLDIASTAWSPVDRPHERRGPTGFGVRLLARWLERFCK